MNKRLILEFLLVAALFIGGWAYNRKVSQLEAARDQVATLAEDLKYQITIKDNQIKILNRRKDGKVIVRKVYVPAEGGTTVVQSTPTASAPSKPPPGTPIDLGDGTIVYIKNKGLTFKPGFGFDFDGFKARAHLDAKVIYWNRYGMGLGGSSGGLGVNASRHLDDILWLRPLNVEFFLQYRIIRLNDGNHGSVGIRSNF